MIVLTKVVRANQTRRRQTCRRCCTGRTDTLRVATQGHLTSQHNKDTHATFGHWYYETDGGNPFRFNGQDVKRVIPNHHHDPLIAFDYHETPCRFESQIPCFNRRIPQLHDTDSNIGWASLMPWPTNRRRQDDRQAVRHYTTEM